MPQNPVKELANQSGLARVPLQGKLAVPFGGAKSVTLPNGWANAVSLVHPGVISRVASYLRALDGVVEEEPDLGEISGGDGSAAVVVPLGILGCGVLVEEESELGYIAGGHRAVTVQVSS